MTRPRLFSTITLTMVLFACFSVAAWGASKDKPGWCCKNGSLKQTLQKDCLDKGGQFFTSSNEAKDFCAQMQKGYCLKNDAIKPANRKQCTAAGGDFFTSKAKAVDAYQSQEGLCVTASGIDPSRRGQCKAVKGQFFQDKADAQAAFEAQKGYCVTEENIEAARRGKCPGQFFIQKKKAAAVFESQKGFCLEGADITGVLRKACRGSGARFFVSRDDAAKALAAKKGWCVVGDTVAAAPQGACLQKKGNFFSSKEKAAAFLDHQKGWCVANGRMAPLERVSCRNKQGTFYLTRMDAANALKRAGQDGAGSQETTSASSKALAKQRAVAIAAAKAKVAKGGAPKLIDMGIRVEGPPASAQLGPGDRINVTINVPERPSDTPVPEDATYVVFPQLVIELAGTVFDGSRELGQRTISEIPSTYHLSFPVPDDVPSAGHYFVVAYTTDESRFGVGDMFTILGSDGPMPWGPAADHDYPLEVRLSAPNGREEWSQGATYTISWRMALTDPSIPEHMVGWEGAPFEVTLWQGDTMVQSIDSGPTEHRHFTAGHVYTLNWTVPEELPRSDDYRIRVKGYWEGTANQDISEDTFSIAPANSLWLTMPPESGTRHRAITMSMGPSYKFSWQVRGTARNESLRIELHESVSMAQRLADMQQRRNAGFMGSLSATSHHTVLARDIRGRRQEWTFRLREHCADIPGSGGDGYYIKLVTDSGQTSTSVPFTLEMPQLTVTSPGAGAVWTRGEQGVIQWSGHKLPGGGSVDIDLLQNGESYMDIALNVPIRAGNFRWNVGRDGGAIGSTIRTDNMGGPVTAAGEYTIRVRMRDCRAVAGESAVVRLE